MFNILNLFNLNIVGHIKVRYVTQKENFKRIRTSFVIAGNSFNTYTPNKRIKHIYTCLLQCTWLRCVLHQGNECICLLSVGYSSFISTRI